MPPSLVVSVWLHVCEPTDLSKPKSYLPDSASGRGAFSQYAKTFSDVVWEIPEGTLSFEQAAATASPCDSSFSPFYLTSHPRFDITTSLNTAFQALYGAKELGLTQRFDSAPPKGTENTWVFIYGGSSGVGQFAIQLAKLSGYKVVTVASPRNHEFLKGLGADAVFDVCTLTCLCVGLGG